MFNLSNVNDTITRGIGRTLLMGRKYSPEILMTVGVVGVVTAGVLASRASFKKVRPILEAKNERIEHIRESHVVGDINEQEQNKQIARVYIHTTLDFAKVYGPAVSLGVLSVVSIVSAHGIMRRRNVALAAAYKTVEQAFSEYRKRVAEEIGEDAEYELRRDRHEVEVTNEETGEVETVQIEGRRFSPYAKFFDEFSPYWQKNADYNLTFLTTKQTMLTQLLRARGYLFLNEVYQELGIPITQAGQQVGWLYDRETGDDFVDFGIYVLTSEEKRAFVNGYERSILLDFNVDGPILNMI